MVGTTPQKRDILGHIYLGRAGADLPRYLAEYVGRESRAEVREDLLRYAGPTARSDDRVLELGGRALTDRSGKVRRMGAWLLALSAKPAALLVITSWQPRDASDMEYRARAIRVIERQDIQEWVRDTPYSGVVPWQFSRHEVGSEQFDAEVDHFVKRFAADLVPDLELALGDLYLAQ